MKILKNRRGQGMTEYIIIVAVISIAAIVAFKTFGGKVIGSIGKASVKLEDSAEEGINTTDDGTAAQ